MLNFTTPVLYLRYCALVCVVAKVTPFDVVKTRLQTQPPKPKSHQLFARPPQNTCCQPNNIPCVRGMSSLAISAFNRSEVVCVWDHGVLRQERVHGFYDAIKHVVRVEGLKGLWKGAGTTMFAFIAFYSYQRCGLIKSYLQSDRCSIIDGLYGDL